MFRSFFGNRRWMHWSLFGSILILGVTWYKVQLDVRINEWFGDFYDTLQKALAEPGAVTFDDFLEKCLTFAEIAALYILIAVLLEFFVRHYVFRWRTAMNDYYMFHWPQLRHIEGAAQRVQEDTMRFARIVEGLGVAFMRSVMTLFAFLPLLWGLSAHVTELPWIGGGRSLPCLACNRFRCGRHRPAGGRGHQAAGPRVQQPEGRGGLPQGTGLWRRRRRKGRAPDGPGIVRRCAPQLFPPLSPLHVFRCREMVLPAIRGHGALHHDGGRPSCQASSRSACCSRSCAPSTGSRDRSSSWSIPGGRLSSSSRSTSA